MQGYGGLLEELRQRCLAQGCTESFYPDYGPTNCAVRIELRKGIGGFCLVYNSRKTQRFAAGTLNGMGEKRMLERFADLGEGRITPGDLSPLQWLPGLYQGR